MAKKKKHNVTLESHRIRWWYFGVVAVFMLPVSAYFLRQNNLTMLELRDQVVRLDQETGDIAQIQPALLELREHVLTHMNASPAAPIHLPGSFDAAVAREVARVEQSGSANAQVYRDAQDQCEIASVQLSVRAQCIQDYVLSNAAPGTDADEIDYPPKEQFIYSFISPRWSFDLAGLSVLVSSLLGLITIATFLLDVIVPRVNKSIQNDPLE